VRVGSRRPLNPVRPWVLVLVLALLAVPGSGLLSGCGRDTPAIPGVEVLDPQDRAPMPALAGPTLDGSPLDVADLSGSIVVLNNWASWCAPCRDEMPYLVALAESDPRVRVVGLNVRDEPAAAQAFAVELGVGFPSIVDPEGLLLRTIPGVPPAALPSTVVLDRSGRIAARVIGPTSAEQLQELVDAAAR